MFKKVVAISLLAFSTVGVAEDQKPELLKPIKLEINDPLTEQSWKDHWQKAKGKWYFLNDAIVGEEIPEEKHHAGAGREHSMQSGMLQIEFRIEKSDKLQFGLDYSSTEKKDHLLRVIFDNKGNLSVRAGSGWGPTTKMLPVGKPVKIDPLKPGQWYTAMVEFNKQEIVVHFEGHKVFTGNADANLDLEKNRIALNARGLVSFRNVKYWSGKKE
jgi:hypothetical protein